MDVQGLEPAATIIRRCGGIAATARIVGRHRSVVSRWMKAKDKGGTGGTIPMQAAVLLLRHGPGLKESDFFRTAAGLTLDAWMQARGVSDDELARVAECSPATISRLRRGRQTASERLAARIEAITGGQVPRKVLRGRESGDGAVAPDRAEPRQECLA